ncbi:MAG: chorismate lyase [Methylomicrobium sp.]
MPIKSVLFTQEPRWVISRSRERHAVLLSVQSWLFEPGSITQRLRSYYGDAVQVQVLQNDRLVPFLSERRLLRLGEARYALTREVMIHADGLPLILARTLIPDKTVKAARRNLAHLGSRPLGEVIFSYPKLERQEMEFACIEPEIWTPFAIDQARIDSRIWGRRTVYLIRRRPLLVNEFFLPTILGLS